MVHEHSDTSGIGDTERAEVRALGLHLWRHQPPPQPDEVLMMAEEGIEPDEMSQTRRDDFGRIVRFILGLSKNPETCVRRLAVMAHVFLPGAIEADTLADVGKAFGASRASASHDGAVVDSKIRQLGGTRARFRARSAECAQHNREAALRAYENGRPRVNGRGKKAEAAA